MAGSQAALRVEKRARYYRGDRLTL